MCKSYDERQKPVDRVHDLRGIFVQGKSVVHTKMLNEG
jgi:hypothetical protein